MIAEAAIASFLSPDADDRREAALAKRLDRIDRTIQRLERDVGIANEAFAIFIRFWLTSTAPLPESVQAAAHVKGGERYDKFLEALGRRLAKGPWLRQELSEDGGVAFREEPERFSAHSRFRIIEDISLSVIPRPVDLVGCLLNFQ